MPRGRRSEVTDADRRYVHERKRAGISDRIIAEEMTAQGRTVSAETVRKIGKEPEPSAPERGLEATPDPLDVDGIGAAEVVLPDLPEDADLAAIELEIRRNERQLGKAEADGNIVAFTQLQRIRKDLIDRQRRWRPRDADAELSPDLVAAGERAEQRLHDMIDRAFDSPAGPLKVQR